MIATMIFLWRVNMQQPKKEKVLYVSRLGGRSFIQPSLPSIKCAKCGRVLLIVFSWYLHRSGMYCDKCAPKGSRVLI